MSRKSLPKQFAPIVGEHSLFEAAAARVQYPEFADPIIVTSQEHRFLVEKQLRPFRRSGHILLEPAGKNTAPAIFASAHYVMENFGDALMLAMPSDHHITDQDAFKEMVLSGQVAADEGAVITFGVEPSRPETGYGYIEVDQASAGDAIAVRKFHEKPCLHTAQQMLNDRRYLWNAGIFLFRASTILYQAEKFEAEMMSATRNAIINARKDKNCLYLDEAIWANIKSQSIDYAILEKADNIACVRFAGSWSDLGDWNSVAEQLPHDDRGNHISGAASQIDCVNTTLWSESSRIHLVGLGLKNIVTVVVEDAVLVADAASVQDVREVAEYLDTIGVSQATQHSKSYRPWGWFESLTKLPGYQVKRLHVYPGAALSLQSHKHRSEHWVVVDGTAKVVRDDEILTLQTNESVYIHVGQKHRLVNETDMPLTVIEVQTGDYLAEDDIIRYEDVYSRV
jgi:mannose-1-phosphate guanylyltransferase/mannose-6-phosphate isomerase